MERVISGILSLLVCVVWCFPAWAQRLDRSMFAIQAEPESETVVVVKKVRNGSGFPVKIAFSGKEHDAVPLASGEERVFDRRCSTVRVIYGSGESFTIWSRSDTKKVWKEKRVGPEPQTVRSGPESEPLAASVKTVSAPVTTKAVPVKNNSKPVELDAGTFMNAFLDDLENDVFLSRRSINWCKAYVERHIEDLNSQSHRDDYVRMHGLKSYVNDLKDSVIKCRENIPLRVVDFIAFYKDKGAAIADLDRCEEDMRRILESRLSERETLSNRLADVVHGPAVSETAVGKPMSGTMWLNVIVIAVLLAVLCVWFFYARRKKRHKFSPAPATRDLEHGDMPTIVVRRKTTSILKRQSLEDVTVNKGFLKIECTDFCEDSAVRCIYLKNTCIKEIYNLYAEDLRNPDNPKEDGCMVLGRWVQDKETGEYFVSLEQIVKPGDDAVFQEYELNFGGKIKLKVAEKLRKLRRETNLQYDLTCWVHSHPGLGVFFSNSDDNVQHQLKHPTHPNFLTAIVIDILTPEQELGIFTFKRDGTVNSKNDLKRLYSLEAWHEWAVESDKYAFKAEDHYNILSKAENCQPTCAGVELSNSSIIDMCELVSQTVSGIAGWAYGYKYQSEGQTEYVVKNITKSHIVGDGGVSGCLVVGTHCSIPTIRKIVALYVSKINFVLFYSTSDETVTAIPLNGGQLNTDETCYGEETLKNLKIWTRRRR